MINIMWPDELDLDLDLDDFLEEITKETESIVPSMHWKDAYEANKIRKTCILCGKPTVKNFTLTPYIMYCPCVEELAKKEKI